MIASKKDKYMVCKIPEQVELEETECQNGCQAGNAVVLTGFDRLHYLGGFTVYSLVAIIAVLERTNPCPTQETISFYYPDEYAPHHNAVTHFALKKNCQIFLILFFYTCFTHFDIV